MLSFVPVLYSKLHAYYTFTLGHLLSPVPRKTWWLIGKKYTLYILMVLEVWTKDVYLCYEFETPAIKEQCTRREKAQIKFTEEVSSLLSLCLPLSPCMQWRHPDALHSSSHPYAEIVFFLLNSDISDCIQISRERERRNDVVDAKY